MKVIFVSSLNRADAEDFIKFLPRIEALADYVFVLVPASISLTEFSIEEAIDVLKGCIT